MNSSRLPLRATTPPDRCAARPQKGADGPAFGLRRWWGGPLSLLLPLLVLPGVLPTPALAQTAVERKRPDCDDRASLGDFREISCRLVARNESQGFRFKAHFGGGHDDTKASMTTYVDGTAVACEQGSKTRLFGEDGDISLECLFRLPGGGPVRVLKVEIQWSHAQYRAFELLERE